MTERRRDCVDLSGWADRDGDTCAVYAKSRWCNATGGFGIEWPKSWDAFPGPRGRASPTAADACCACGGGSSNIPSASIRTEAPTSSISSKNADAATSDAVPNPPEAGNFLQMLILVAAVVAGITLGICCIRKKLSGGQNNTARGSNFSMPESTGFGRKYSNLDD